MPLMRIRSVEIVFEDEISTYTDTGLLDRSIELIVSDSDDSTRCVDDLEHLQERDDDSVTLNAEADLSDDNSFSPKDNAIDSIPKCERNVQESDSTRESKEPVILARENNTISLNLSELGDSGRYTEEASSSHAEVPFITYDDAVLSHSYDAVRVDNISPVISMYEVNVEEKDKNRLYEYVDSNSDSSDNTAVYDGDNAVVTLQTALPDIFNIEDQNFGDNNDLQYDSFVDIGKF
ncbi:unnamed protein product [Euphydryas editha]|uniref:Uncharacterized protein n=1 Tax=Euphydryas editha TaxID=104508 RepID=A0AAU9V5Q0_EUPED|nr:unnamed protein product [Euphydryas editha]